MSNNKENMTKCIIHFHQENDWKDFRYLELDALLEMYNVNPRSAYTMEGNIDSPYLIIYLPNIDIAKAVCKRCILIKSIFEFWGGKNIKNTVV